MTPDKALSTLAPMLGVLVLGVMFTGCERDSAHPSSHKQQEDLQTTLLDEGFYGKDQSVGAVGQTSPLAPTAEPTLAEQPFSKQEDDPDPVASVGFSTIEETPPPSTNDANYSDTCAISDAAPVITAYQACQRISKRLASVSMSDCESANLSSSHCQSVQNFPILVREFPPLDNRIPQGRVLVIGGTHGDELTSVSVVFRWIGKLNRFHSGLFHWRIAPMINPDGVLKRGATRTNQNGVDLNRNLPSDDWDENALKYWDEKSGKNKRRYPGARAASEPETQWLIEEIKTFKPDAIISVHAPFGVVDYDSLSLNQAPKKLGKLALNLLGTYPGSLGNYAGINRNIPVITLELPHAWVMPSERESTKIWEDIVRWLRINVNRTDVASEAN